jgi:hypothetical protein
MKGSATQMPEVTEFHLSTRRGKGSMLKQACLFGLLVATTVVSFDSVARGDSAKNGQLSGQEAAAIGAFNTIRQSSNQFNLVNVQQPTSGLPGSSSVPNPATSGQSAKQAAGAMGVGNQIQQRTRQGNLQRQIPQPSSLIPLPF